MRSNLLTSGLLIILLGGCAGTDRSRATPTAAADGCNVTQPIHPSAPQNTQGGPADATTAPWAWWYINGDRSIWMLQQPLVARQRNKIAWFRPDGADLRVSGRRLDAAAPLSVEITPAAYQHQFCPSILIFRPKDAGRSSARPIRASSASS